MPAGFEWGIIDVTSHDQINEMYKLLTENYVEDDGCQFRYVSFNLSLLNKIHEYIILFYFNSFDYSVPFLQWALSPPGYIPDWIVGVYNSKTKKLMGCITGIPAHIKVYDIVSPMAEINFLCVHKKLRLV